MEKSSITRLHIKHGTPTTGECKDCHRKFEGPDSEDIQRQHAEHVCEREDFSQAAVRIVREATKD